MWQRMSFHALFIKCLNQMFKYSYHNLVVTILQTFQCFYIHHGELSSLILDVTAIIVLGYKKKKHAYKRADLINDVCVLIGPLICLTSLSFSSSQNSKMYNFSKWKILPWSSDHVTAGVSNHSFKLRSYEWLSLIRMLLKS